MCLLLSLRPKMLIALIRDESNTYYCKDFWLKRVPQLQVQWNLYLRPPLYNGHFFLAATVFGGQSIHWLLFEPLYNGLLSTTATFFLRPLFLADSPYIGSSLNLSTTVSCLQRPLPSVPKVSVVEGFNCIDELPRFRTILKRSWFLVIVLKSPWIR